MSSQKLWVQHKTPGKSLIDLVSIDGCEYVDDFRSTLYVRPLLAIPRNIPIILYKPDGKTEIDVGESPADYLNENSRTNPLIVRITAQVQSTAFFVHCQIPFYSDISKAAELNGWLLFAHHIPFTELNRLYIRESFKIIASSIKPGMNKSIITGTPGIGMSWFMIYLLWKLVKAGKRVLFVYYPYKVYYDGQGGVFQFPENYLPSCNDVTFWSSDLWCLFDERSTNEEHLSAFPYSRCKFVLSTSPRHELVFDFQKPPLPQIFYIPLWSETEMESIAPFFGSVVDWRDRFKILGGIPRYVLEVTCSEPTKLLQSACYQCELDDFIKVDSTITENVHFLVHITSTDPFTESYVTFASQSVLDIIAAIKGFEAKRRIIELLESCESSPLAASLCGYIFERYAIALLEKGGIFTCRQLVHGNKKAKSDETTLTIQASEKLFVEKVSLYQARNRLHLPKTKNCAAFDAWIPGIGAFQMTVGKAHRIKDGAADDLAMLGRNANKLYWLLPPMHYNSFTKKSPQDIDEYAVRIPYPAAE